MSEATCITYPQQSRLCELLQTCMPSDSEQRGMEPSQHREGEATGQKHLQWKKEASSLAGFVSFVPLEVRAKHKETAVGAMLVQVSVL